MKITRLFPAIAALCAVTFNPLSAQVQDVVIPLTPVIRSSEAEKPIVLQELSINIEVVGGIAVTRYDMVFGNPNNRDLEGELLFPLAQDEIVTGYSLEVNGKMRDGVIVDKDKGRQVFEEIVNRQVDPGLLEKQTGNSYKTRIYPVPAKGYKRVSVSTHQKLRVDGDRNLYVLPMSSPVAIGKFQLTARVLQGGQPPEVIDGPLSNFRFETARNVYESTFTADKYKLKGPLVFSVPANEVRTFTEIYDGTEWFYATVPGANGLRTSKPGNNRRQIAIWWDVSLSGLGRDLEKEYQLVETYLSSLNSYDVQVATFSDKVHSYTKFSNKEGVDEVISYLRGLTYDGATDLGCLFESGTGRRDRILLFSDGCNSLGQDMSGLSVWAPLYAVTSGPENDYGALGSLSRGNVLNLTTATIPEAVERLNDQALQVIEIVAIDGKIDEVYPKAGAFVSGDVVVTGKLRSEGALIRVSLGTEGNVLKTEHILIGKTREDISQYAIGHAGLLARLWAQERIAELSFNSGKNKQEITRIGERYGVVTDFTSLIVLEDIEDYVMYDITPPSELQDDSYFRLLKEKNSGNGDEKQTESAADIVASDYERYYAPLIQWWNTDYPVNKTPSKEKLPGYIDGDYADIVLMEDSWIVEEAEVVEMAFMRVESSGGSASDFIAEASEMAAPGDRSRRASERTLRNTISLGEWRPETPYMRELSNAMDIDLYGEYLRVREDYMDTPSFFADVADEFFRRGEVETARRVLSNIVELSAGNIELVKTYGHKLIEYGLYDDAVPVFVYGARLRPEHPQSFRDVALAWDYAGNPEKALENYLEVLTRKWDRFDNIKPIVFTELNSLIDRSRRRLDTREIPEKLIFSMPVNTRITISWGTDNCDIDLHVTDPSGQECSYRHKLTSLGGRMSDDFTDGFGPEAYMMKKKQPGKYGIMVNYFGSRSQKQLMPVTVYADVFTDYGTANQKRERITLRLGNARDKYKVGEITVE